MACHDGLPFSYGSALPTVVIISWMSTEKKHRMTTMALMDVPLPGFNIVRGQQLYDIECCPFLLFSW